MQRRRGRVVGEVALGKLDAFRQIAARLAAGIDLKMEPVDPMLGGLPVPQWFDVFYDTHAGTGMGGFARTEWPEPGGYADQPSSVVTALALVGEAILKQAGSNGGK